MARHCKNCGEPGHYAPTCPKGTRSPQRAKVARTAQQHKGSVQRRCKKCGQLGHMQKTCQNNTSNVPQDDLESLPSAVVVPGQKDPGEKYRIMEQMKGPKVNRPEFDGLKAARGLWILNKNRQRIAGQILRVRRSGTIVWRDFSGHSFVNRSSPATFERAGYVLAQDLPDEQGWQWLNLGEWIEMGRENALEKISSKSDEDLEDEEEQ